MQKSIERLKSTKTYFFSERYYKIFRYWDRCIRNISRKKGFKMRKKFIFPVIFGVVICFLFLLSFLKAGVTGPCKPEPCVSGAHGCEPTGCCATPVPPINGGWYCPEPNWVCRSKIVYLVGKCQNKNDEPCNPGAHQVKCYQLFTGTAECKLYQCGDEKCCAESCKECNLLAFTVMTGECI